MGRQNAGSGNENATFYGAEKKKAVLSDNTIEAVNESYLSIPPFFRLPVVPISSTAPATSYEKKKKSQAPPNHETN